MCKKNILQVALLIFILSIPNKVAALHYTTLSVKEGLSSRKVIDLTKDLKGYLWIATSVGIDRFNGEEFTTYTLDTDKTGIKKPKGILTDLSGNIYAFSEKKVYQFNTATDKFSTLENIFFSNRETIQILYFDKNNFLWIGTSNGLYSYENKAGLKTYDITNRPSVYTITTDHKNQLWIGTDTGVFKCLRSSEDNIALEENPTLMVKGRIETFYFDSITKFLWVGTFSEGLSVINTEEGNIEYLHNFKFNFPIRSITQINDSALWLGIDGGGIFEFNRFHPEFKNEYNQSTSKPDHNIPTNNIYDIVSDSTHIWVSTYNAGIFTINKKAIKTIQYLHQPTLKNSLSNNHINAVLEDRSGNLWFGTNDGVSLFNTTTGKWKQFLQGKNTLSVILTLCEDINGNILAGGYATNLSIINARNGEVTSVINPINNQKFKYTYSIIQDESRVIWFGGILDKLTSYDPATRIFKEYNIRGINKIVEYNTDTLLLATIKGLVIFDKVKGEFNRVDFNKINPEMDSYPFLNNVNYNIKNKDLLWIGTEQFGVLVYDIKNNNIEQWSTKKGLSSNNTYSILFDKQDRVWVSTEYGLNCISAKENSVDTYTQNDGLPCETFNFLAYSPLRSGNMIWGTVEGAIEINPKNIEHQGLSSPKLVFETFTLFNKEINAGTTDSPIEENIDNITKINLNHSQHSFSFGFIDLNRQKHEKIFYSWILEGFDKEWSKPSSNHNAIYTNIPPGKYLFKVKSFTSENESIQDSREIIINIKKPLWATGYAIFVYLLLIVIISYFLHRMYSDRIETRESNKKIKFFINMAHDIRTPLTLIKAPLNEIADESLSESGINALDLALRNTEKLQNMVTQLLDFQKIEGEAMTLHIEKTNISEFIESIATNFILLASEKHIDFTLDLQESNLWGWIDRKKITTILDNILSNALKYTLSNGNVLLRLSLSPNKKNIHIEIVDDGIGISKNDQKQLFNRFYRAENAANSSETGSGIGLLLTKKMVHLHKGEISFSSIEHIGTKFSVNIPINKEEYSDYEIISNEEIRDITLADEQKTENENTIQILLVEDNEELRNYLAKFLRKNYEVKEASNGDEALIMIQKNNPDFVISDVLMPKISGIELTQQLKSNINTCHIPIILLTSLAEREDIIKGFNAGADDYITKPFDVSILETKINAINKNRLLYKKKYIDRSAFEDSSQIATNLDRDFMRQVLDKIEDNIANDNFNIDSLALEMAMSRTVFYNKIRSLTGQSPIDIIIDVRMKKAANLLREKKYTIAEIAYLTGNSNPKYFSTAFKKYYGVSPSSFIQEE